MTTDTQPRDELRSDGRPARPRLAVVAAGLAVAVVVAVPAALLATRDTGTTGTTGAGTAAPTLPPGAERVPAGEVVATNSELTVGMIRGACDPEATGAATLLDGRWHLALWQIGHQPTGRICTDQAINYLVRIPLSEPYAGQPVVDEATGQPVAVNGGPGFLLPTYLPPGYSIEPGMKGVNLAGPDGPIMVIQGGRQVGTISEGWPYDVLDRPVIAGQPGLLVRFRNDGDNTMLRWVTEDGRGVSLQIFSATFDPQELVRIARSMR